MRDKTKQPGGRAVLFSVGCGTILRNCKGKKWAFKSSANLFKGWNIVTRNNLNLLPSLHCGQFGVNRPGIQGSFDLVEFLTALNGSHTISSTCFA